MSFRNLEFLFKQNMTNGSPFIKHADKICESCILGKYHGDAFPKRSSRRDFIPTNLVHADVCSPMQILSINNIYLVIFVDDYSRMTLVFFGKEKPNALHDFEKSKNYVEKNVVIFLIFCTLTG